MRGSVLMMGLVSFALGIVCKLSDDPNFIHYYIAGVICLCTLSLLEK